MREAVLVLNGLGQRYGEDCVLCPEDKQIPSRWDPAARVGRDGVPVYDPMLGYTHDVDLFPAGHAPDAPWTWGGLEGTFQEAYIGDYPATVMPRPLYWPSWSLGQLGQKMTSKTASVMPTAAPRIFTQVAPTTTVAPASAPATTAPALISVESLNVAAEQVAVAAEDAAAAGDEDMLLHLQEQQAQIEDLRAQLEEQANSPIVPPSSSVPTNGGFAPPASPEQILPEKLPPEEAGTTFTKRYPWAVPAAIGIGAVGIGLLLFRRRR